MRTHPPTQRHSNRRGFALVLSILSLVLFGLAAAVLVQSLDWQRGVVQSDAIRLQVDWLAQSAVNRAAAKLNEQPDYVGETWAVPATELDGTATAKITITAAKAAEPAKRHQVQIHVEYQRSGDVVARLTRSAVIDSK